MTDDEKRKQWMDIYTASFGNSDAPSVTEPSASNTQAAEPNTSNAAQAGLQDKFGTGFINYSQYGSGSPYTQQYQPIPGSSGSLYDPTASTPATPFLSTMPKWPTQGSEVPGPLGPPENPAEPPDAPNMGPIEKPLFRRTRAALGYRGGEY